MLKELRELRAKIDDLLSGNIKDRLDRLENQVNATKIEIKSPDGESRAVMEATDPLTGVWVQNKNFMITMAVEGEKAYLSIKNLKTGEVRSL